MLPARDGSIIKLHLLILLFFNLMIPVVLALILGPLVSLPCISPLAIAFSEFAILLLLFHLAWRCLSPAIRGLRDSVKVGVVAFPVRGLSALFDTLHPWAISDGALWSLSIFLISAAVVVGLSPLSPFPILTERTPIVQNFSVQYLEEDRPTMSFRPGDVVEMMLGEQVLVQAEILGPSDTLCTWSTTHGNLLPAEGCAILYSAPFRGTRDVLVTLAQSPCKTQAACASLHVKVVLHSQ